VTIFTGEQPAEDIPGYLAAADVLVSPRSRGKNTPLKIYQYLRAARPIVATNLLTHTQVLDDTVACLAGATPEAFAGGILRVIGDAPYARALATAAARLAATRYTYDAYLARTKLALDQLGGPGPSARTTI
jgi:glycosyltransferase involved in cell wall biosynthesis